MTQQTQTTNIFSQTALKHRFNVPVPGIYDDVLQMITRAIGPFGSPYFEQHDLTHELIVVHTKKVKNKYNKEPLHRDFMDTPGKVNFFMCQVKHKSIAPLKH